jgi:hypothetical protein
MNVAFNYESKCIVYWGIPDSSPTVTTTPPPPTHTHTHTPCQYNDNQSSKVKNRYNFWNATSNILQKIENVQHIHDEPTSKTSCIWIYFRQWTMSSISMHQLITAKIFWEWFIPLKILNSNDNSIMLYEYRLYNSYEKIKWPSLNV